MDNKTEITQSAAIPQKPIEKHYENPGDKPKARALPHQNITAFYPSSIRGERKSIDVITNITKDFIPWEPKQEQRHLVYLTNKKGKTIVPSFLIKEIDRPSFCIEKGKKVFDTMKMTLYDPIVPSAAQLVWHSIKRKEKWNIVLNLLGTVGDKVEEWEIKNAKVNFVKFSSCDWSNTGDPATITVFITPGKVKLNY